MAIFILPLREITEEDSRAEIVELRMKLYQGTALKNSSPAIQEKSKQDALLDLTRLNERTSDNKLLRFLLVFLEIQTWAMRSYGPSCY